MSISYRKERFSAMDNELETKVNLFLKAALPYIMIGGGLGLLLSLGGINTSGT
jgi:hypothetical protein